MPLIEREHLLSQLTDLYATAAAGRGRVALVDGGVASGKTELVDALAEQAAAEGALVLTAACSLAESTIPLGVVNQLCHGADLRLDVAVRDPDASTLRHDDARLLEDVCRLLLDLAADRPLVVVVDDVQFADPLSLQALLYLQRRIRAARVLLVLSGCVSARPAGAAFHAELTRQPHCKHLRLLPLSRDGVGRLLAERFTPEVARRFAAPAHALSGGNPMLVHALADDSLVTQDVPAVGDAFVHAALACLHRSDPRLLDVARAVAVAGPRASTDLVAALADVTPAATRQAVAALAEAGLVDGHEFHHPAVRAAVREDCPPGELTALRHKAARLRHDSGAPAAEVAEHLVAAGEPVEPWAVPVLVAAADEAATHDATAHALDCLDLALASTADPRERAALEADLVRLHWRAKPANTLRYLPSLLDAARNGHLDTADALLLARSLAWHGRYQDAEDVLAAVDAEHSDPDIAADHRATVAWLHHCHPTESAALPQVTGSTGSAPPRLPLDRAEEVLQRARPGDTLLVAAWSALRALISADRLDRAAHWCDRLHEDADRRGTTSWRAVLEDVRAAIALRRGDLAAAQRHATTALDTMSAACWGVAIGSPLAHLVLAATLAGHPEQADEALRRPTPPALRQSAFWPRYLWARGVHYDAADRQQAALADFRAAGDLAVRWDVDDPSGLPWRVDLARVHVRLGRPERARELVTEHLALPGADSPRAKGMGLRALAAACAPKQRQAVLSEAMDLLHASGDRHELAHAFADLSQTGQALGEFGRAKMMGRRALQLAEGCHAGLLRKKLQPLHDALDERDGGAVDGLAALSDAERRVVDLAARGHTNREIGHKLFITVSTVEQHLTRAYRKLGISGRSDLVPIGPTEEVFA
ncbi:helix-turn-helix transcriptional regulator [Saccharothrix variisporea]|uniref:Regulatory LuxR family protein n=1 Tax=Saccharothrix variisporea TaxID=543527 RepID=A0A495X878_9PSEU|nr:LuxR family transcriptional regulator [Saccharothrix variisporea]RKT70212.1 regulatory LuxR family protein [Saccharothrix variisporea]